MRGAVGIGPQRLYPWILERLESDLIGDLAEPAGGGSGKQRHLLGKQRGDLRLHIDVRVELIDQVVGEGPLDVGLLEQLGARIDPAVRLQQLPFRPDGEDGEQSDQRGDDDERQRQPAARGALRGAHLGLG